MRARIYFLEGIGSGTVGEKIERSRVQKLLIFIFFLLSAYFLNICIYMRARIYFLEVIGSGTVDE